MNDALPLCGMLWATVQITARNFNRRSDTGRDLGSDIQLRPRRRPPIEAE